MVKNGHDLLGRETLKSAYLMNGLINWAVFFFILTQIEES